MQDFVRENNNDHMQDFVRENYNDLNLYAFGITHSDFIEIESWRIDLLSQNKVGIAMRFFFSWWELLFE